MAEFQPIRMPVRCFNSCEPIPGPPQLAVSTLAGDTLLFGPPELDTDAQSLRRVLTCLESLGSRLEHLETGQGRVEASVGEVRQNVACLLATGPAGRSGRKKRSDELLSSVVPPQPEDERTQKVQPADERTQESFGGQKLRLDGPVAGSAADEPKDREAPQPAGAGKAIAHLAAHGGRRAARKAEKATDAKRDNVATVTDEPIPNLTPGHHRLLHLMELDESNKDQEEDKKQEIRLMRHYSMMAGSRGFKDKLLKDLDTTTAYIDTVMSCIIIVNAIVIGVAAEVENESVFWIGLNMLFTIIFIAEAALRFWLCGWRRLLFGSGRYLECFDLAIVVLDLIQAIQICYNGFNRSNDSAPVSILRLFRLARLARIGRLVRFYRGSVFTEFFVMLNGLLVGLSTLFWALIVFSLPVYLGAMIMRETLGRLSSDQDEYGVSSYFNTVPRSMFTMFRCAFGDCSTAGGMPVFELVQEAYGWGYSAFYSVFVFVIAVGLFNVVSAVFVDNVMSASMLDELALKHRRLSDENLLAANLAVVIGAALQRLGSSSDKDERIIDKFETIQTLEITTEIFEDMLKDSHVVSALDDLDISPEDHDNLFDILDSDNSGTMLFEELLSGLEKLRGDPRRSDIVCVDLMLRSIQHNQNEMIKNQSDMMRRLGTEFSTNSFVLKALTHGSKSFTEQRDRADDIGSVP